MQRVRQIHHLLLNHSVINSDLPLPSVKASVQHPSLGPVLDLNKCITLGNSVLKSQGVDKGRYQWTSPI